MPESDYLRRETENHPDEPEYLNDLRILRRFVQKGSVGYRQSDDVIFRTLKARYPEALQRLRNVMILSKLGYGSREMAMLEVNSRRRYPEAYDAFEGELEDL
jgi:hypothetical protein